MTRVAVLAVSVLMAVLLGSVPCRSVACTSQTLENCLTKNARGVCYAHVAVVTCVKSLINKCDDALKVVAGQMIGFHDARKNDCSGLPSGTCFEQELGQCVKNIPGVLWKKKTLSASVKKTYCKGMIRTTQLAKYCLNQLQPKCLFRRPSIFHTFFEINKVISLCAGADK